MTKPRMPVRTAGTRVLVAAAAAALLGLALAAAGSCSDECSRNSDCSAGQSCVRGSCVAPPGADADADGRMDVEAHADADADGPGEVEAEAGADADADDVPVGPDADADGDVVSDVPVCGCTSAADCPITLPCFHQVCNPATGCCEGGSLVQIPNYCASRPGPTYCAGGMWCLDRVEMAGTDGVSRCDDAEPPEVDNCAPNGSTGACELTVALTCPW